MSSSRSVNSSIRDSGVETNGGDDNSVVTIEGNWAFPAEDGVLSAKHLHMNPDWSVFPPPVDFAPAIEISQTIYYLLYPKN
jgi:hypothetical protein